MKSTLKLILAFVIVLGVSCKKEDSEIKQKTTLLTKAGWLTQKVEEKKTDGTWKDVTGTPLVTQQDDILLFRADGSYELNEGPLKFPGDPQVIASGTWTFLENGAKIQIVNGNLMQVIELTDTKLQVIVAGASPNPDQRYTFGHP